MSKAKSEDTTLSTQNITVGVTMTAFRAHGLLNPSGPRTIKLYLDNYLAHLIIVYSAKPKQHKSPVRSYQDPFHQLEYILYVAYCKY